jgi:UDP:flavonoid glycosyltransferase YjiC (YdhE family)
MFGDLQQSLVLDIQLEAFFSQWAVLAHPKTEVFVSHRGGNSTYEGLLNAVPIVQSNRR